jgi:hypothetical protein
MRGQDLIGRVGGANALSHVLGVRLTFQVLTVHDDLYVSGGGRALSAVLENTS